MYSFFCSSDCLLDSGPINREMRHLISTLQTHNQQMKGEVVKYKIRLRETQAELNQVRQELTHSVTRARIYAVLIIENTHIVRVIINCWKQ